jgi:hypothetical protein
MRPRPPLHLEALERRELLASTALNTQGIQVQLRQRTETADPSDLALEIVGTRRGDLIVLRQGTNQVFLDGVPGSARNLANVNLINIRALGGTDHVNLGGLGGRLPVSIQAVVDGGSGGDWIIGGAAADALHGGPGLDQLFGGPGDDLVDGGDGVDFLFGNAGSDAFLGRDGYDVLDDRTAAEPLALNRETLPAGSAWSTAAALPLPETALEAALAPGLSLRRGLRSLARR